MPANRESDPQSDWRHLRLSSAGWVRSAREFHNSPSLFVFERGWAVHSALSIHSPPVTIPRLDLDHDPVTGVVGVVVPLLPLNGSEEAVIEILGRMELSFSMVELGVSGPTWAFYFQALQAVSVSLAQDLI